jgi:hypothetical protein
MSSRREQLRALYGFDFPDDFFRFWEFAKRLKPLEPLTAFSESIQMWLVGPFEVLAGRFDGRTPRYSQLLHWRYHDDPPEFFTVLLGHTDGLHWGYYFDDPPRPGHCVASYYARDSFELSVDGEDLFEATRLNLELHYRTREDYRDDNPDRAADYEEGLRQMDLLRLHIQEFAPTDRQEIGDEYVEKYMRGWRANVGRNERIVAETRENMGIVVPSKMYRRLSLPDKKLWAALRKTDKLAALVEEARQALRDGYPGTALKLGKDLWAVGGEHQTMYAYELLDAAYEALGRDVLREVLRTHRANRDLPSVDILLPNGEEE